MKDIFSPEVNQEIIDRINKLTPSTEPDWGKMNVSQMLAHSNVTYEMLYETKHKKPGLVKKLLLKALVKSVVVSEKPYKKNNPTAPEFKIVGGRDFEKEKKRLIDYLNRTQKLGRDHFDNKESHSFGKLSADEWNNMFYKHIDHHLTQFGV
ncbi:MAG: DUF1569 domain-containing protein [Balneola sp.]